MFGPGALMAFGDSARGALAAIAAALIFSASLYSIALVRHFEPIVVTTISLVSAALWSLPVALFVEGVPAALPDAPVLAAIIVLAVFNTAGANLMLFALVPRAGATFTSYNNYLVPTVAVICGTLFLGAAIYRGVRCRCAARSRGRRNIDDPVQGKAVGESRIFRRLTALIPAC